jgi:hypothetical protein
VLKLKPLASVRTVVEPAGRHDLFHCAVAKIRDVDVPVAVHRYAGGIAKAAAQRNGHTGKIRRRLVSVERSTRGGQQPTARNFNQRHARWGGKTSWRRRFDRPNTQLMELLRTTGTGVQ